MIKIQSLNGNKEEVNLEVPYNPETNRGAWIWHHWTSWIIWEWETVL